MTDPFELLSALDAPRPLPTDLRARLEDALLDGQQPRALSPALRADVLRELPPRRALVRRPAVWISAAAATAAAAVAVALVLGSGPESGTITAAGPSPAPSPTPSSAPAVAAPAAPAAPPPVAAGGAPAAAPAPALAGGTSGAQLTSVSPAAGPLQGGTPVRLRGTGIATARRVLFGARAGTRLRHYKDGSISVVTPAVSSPRLVAVIVVLQDGSRVTRNNGFRYVAQRR